MGEGTLFQGAVVECEPHPFHCVMVGLRPATAAPACRRAFAFMDARAKPGHEAPGECPKAVPVGQILLTEPGLASYLRGAC
jgi:hypothetical protein